MLRRMVNFMRGSVRIGVNGPFPERFLNLCAQNDVVFWQLEWCDEQCLHLTLTRSGAKRARKFAEKAGCSLSVLRRAGLIHFAGHFRRRHALLAGLALSLLTVAVLSGFVLTIEVKGNERVSVAEILTMLHREGLYPGAFGPGLDVPEIVNGAMLHLPELSWMSINLYGTRAEVLVREAVEPPELADRTTPGSVVAKTGGIITHIETLEGEAGCKVGDTVIPGQVLISGDYLLPRPEYSEGTAAGRRHVRADGRIRARTWHTLTGRIPLQTHIKAGTGEQKRIWSLIFLGMPLNFDGNSGIFTGQYDKISRTWTFSLPGGQNLPLAVRCETVRQYRTAEAELNRTAAEQMLRERLEAALSEQLGDNGEQVSSSYTARVQNHVLEVRLQAECREEIGRFVPLQTEPTA